MVLIKTLLYTGVRVAELVAIRIDDALIQPYSGHASRQSLEIYSRLALTDAQASYDQAIGRFPV
ncbi:MAG: hypothetical protein ACR2JK_11710 [Geodermatophilaceae bacterium]